MDAGKCGVLYSDCDSMTLNTHVILLNLHMACCSISLACVHMVQMVSKKLNAKFWRRNRDMAVRLATQVSWMHTHTHGNSWTAIASEFGTDAHDACFQWNRAPLTNVLCFLTHKHRCWRTS